MPRTLLALVVAAGAAVTASPAHASVNCPPIVTPLAPDVEIPGRPPVCTVKCTLGLVATVVPQVEPYSDDWPWCAIQD